MPDDLLPPLPPDLPPEASGDDADDERLIEMLPPERPRPVLRARAAWTLLTVENTADGKFSFNVSGIKPVKGQAVQGWNVNFGTLNVQMNDLGRYLAAYYEEDNLEGRAAWVYTIQQIGTHLYHGLLNSAPPLRPYLAGARRWVFGPPRLMLSFGGPREYLSVPYELLNDGRVPLALHYPISRQITGLTPRHTDTFGQLIGHLRATAQPLRVLLIAAGGADLPEITTLHRQLLRHAAHSKLAFVIDQVQPGPGGLEALLHKLDRCPYHVVHYTGQVYLDRMDPAQDGLLFAAGKNELLGQTLIPTDQLAHWLHSGETRLFYVSGCMCPQVWEPYVLKDRDYLDLFAGLAAAGIPYVLGLRWHVTPASRQRFAALFYESLLRHAPFGVEEAALYARCETQRYDRQDEAWASPLLIAQNPYNTDHP